MKNIFGFPLFFLMSTLLLAGCNNQVQPTNTVIVTASQTDTPLPTLFPTPLPTFTPSPSLPTPSPVPLPKGIFDPFQESIFAPLTVPNHDEIIKTAFGAVHQNSMVEENVIIDSTMGNTVFSVFWEEGDLDLTLIQPDGKEINPSTSIPAQSFDPRLVKDYRSIIFISKSDRERYYIVFPQVGQWKMRIFGKSVPATGSNYMIQVTSWVATGFHVDDFNKDGYVAGDPIKFSLGITDNTSANILVLGYIHGVFMQVTAETPNKNYYTFELYDDGLHNDGQADDGIYGNAFNNTSVKGKYNFYIQASGINNRAYEPFVREYYLSTIVK